MVGPFASRYHDVSCEQENLNHSLKIVLYHDIRFVTTKGLTTCLDPEQGWTTTSGGLNWLRKQERWKGQKQELITIIQEETKQIEKKEEAAGYRLPTWRVLRALQQNDKVTKIVGEAIMSAPPFFESAWRRKITF